MHKKFKVHPSLPRSNYVCYTLLDDNCWGCKNKKSCNSCYRAKNIIQIFEEKTLKVYDKKNSILMINWHCAKSLHLKSTGSGAAFYIKLI